MNGSNLDGRAIIPLRAIPLASGGEISPLAVALAVGDGRHFAEEQKFQTQLTAHYVSRRGTLHPMHPSEFAVALKAISKLAQEGASFWKMIEALPPSVVVCRDNVGELVNEINVRRFASPPFGLGIPPTELSAWPRLSVPDECVVLEGLEILWAKGVAVPLGEDLVRQYAVQDRLTVDEAAAIILGRVPAVRGILASPTYLADLEPGVKQLLNDVRSLRIGMPCHPAFLAKWAVSADMHLPPIFPELIFARLAPAVLALPRDTTASFAPTASSALAAEESHGYDPKLQQRANAVAVELRRKRSGRSPTKHAVAKELAKDDGRSEQNILRRIRNDWGRSR
ncbi:MAG: hypothetical protein ABI667_05170 [Sphingomicrobium sp.]